MNGYRSLAVGLLALVTLAACGGEEPKKEEAQAPVGQVIARVGGQEVTIHELNAERARVNFPADTDEEQIKRQLLAALVERKALEQKAREAGLDRQPTTLLELRRTREQVLAQAYLQQQMAGTPQVQRREAEEFVTDNPHMFSQQESLVFEQLVVNNAEITDPLIKELDAAKTLEQLEQMLSAKNIQFRRRTGTAASGIFPSEVLEQIKSVKEGEILLMRAGALAYFATVTGSRPEPLTGEAAIEAARRILQTRRNQEQLRKVREAAKEGIEVAYVGEYEQLMADQAPGAQPAPAGGPAPAGDATPAPAAAVPTTGTPGAPATGATAPGIPAPVTPAAAPPPAGTTKP